MAIGANSYGSLVEVGAMVPRYANNEGTFDASTNPPLARVEAMIDRVSALVNGCMASLGFDIPITQADSKLIMDNIVIEHVTFLVEGVRGTGRYAPQSKQIAKRSAIAIITEEIKLYLEGIAPGLEDLGAGRSKSTMSRVGFRGEDNAGNTIYPIFSRKGFNNKNTNWDPKSSDTGQS